MAFHLLSKNHAAINAEWNLLTLTSCAPLIDEATTQGVPLVAALKAFSVAKYRAKWPMIG